MNTVVTLDTTSCPDNPKPKYEVKGQIIVDTSYSDPADDNLKEDNVFKVMDKKVRDTCHAVRWHYRYKNEQAPNAIKVSEQEKLKLKAADPHYNPDVLKGNYTYRQMYPSYNGVEVGSFYEEYGYQEQLQAAADKSAKTSRHVEKKRGAVEGERSKK